MLETLKIGRIKLTWLNGGDNHLDGGAMFGVVPKPLWTRKYPVNELNQIAMRTDPILVQVNNKNYLIDTGIGKGKMSEKQKRNYGITEESKIDESLQTLGLSTSDIHAVLMTHFHFDHASGLTKWQDDKLVPVFENAAIVSSEIEWEEMRNPNIRSKNTYWKENWEAIEDRVQTFDKEQVMEPCIKLIHTGGHSDGHAIILMEDGDDTLIHMADIMPTHAHQNVLWVMAYDDYPMTSVFQKEKWMKYGLERKVWYSFYHDAYYRAMKWNENGEVIDSLKISCVKE